MMNGWVSRVQRFFEERAFGVCTRLGEKLGIATSSIRLFFVYTSFLTFGSPVILYLVLAFIMNIRKHLRRRSSAIMDF
jgi:phage shock protein C